MYIIKTNAFLFRRENLVWLWHNLFATWNVHGCCVAGRCLWTIIACDFACFYLVFVLRSFFSSYYIRLHTSFRLGLKRIRSHFECSAKTWLDTCFIMIINVCTIVVVVIVTHWLYGLFGCGAWVRVLAAFFPLFRFDWIFEQIVLKAHYDVYVLIQEHSLMVFYWSFK